MDSEYLLDLITKIKQIKNNVSRSFNPVSIKNTANINT